jgi:hypothetical protein
MSAFGGKADMTRLTINCTDLITASRKKLRQLGDIRRDPTRFAPPGPFF